MTGAESVKFERMLGRLEEAVRMLQEDRKARELECARHWIVTNDMARDMTIEKGTKQGIASAAKAARESIAAEAQTAREAIAAEASARRGQRHWLIERFLPFVYPLAAAVAGWFIAKGI